MLASNILLVLCGAACRAWFPRACACMCHSLPGQVGVKKVQHAFQCVVQSCYPCALFLPRCAFPQRRFTAHGDWKRRKRNDALLR